MYKKYIALGGLVALVFLLTGCQDIMTTINPNFDVTPGASEAEACEEEGGVWGEFGTPAKEMCNIKTSDAGKTCTDSDQCEGYCVTKSSGKNWIKNASGELQVQGQCDDYRYPNGCRVFVESSKIDGNSCD